MAVDFTHNEAVTQTVLRFDTGSILTVPLPFTFATFFNPRAWGAADRVLMAYGPAGEGDSFRLQLSDDDNLVRAVCKEFIFSNISEVGTFSTGDWSHGMSVFEGVDNVPSTSILAYHNGVAGTPFVGSAHSPDAARYFFVGGLSQVLTSTNGFPGCMAHAAMWRIALTALQAGLLSSGTRPDDHAALGTTEADLVFYLELTDEATATVATVGDDFTLFEDPPTGVIATCLDGPIMVSPPVVQIYNRIMG